MLDVEIAIRIINSLFTIGIGLLLAYKYLRKTRFISLSFWSVAFIIYGIQILIRIWYSWNTIEVFVSSVLMSTLLTLGASSLMRKNKIYGPVILILLGIVFLLYPSVNWYKFGAFAFFGAITIAVVHLRLVIGKLANRLIVGWLALLIINVVFVAIYGLEWPADLAAIPAKGILALGMLDQRFARMVIDIKRIYAPR